MEIIYKAFDGTCFGTEEECREYEHRAAFTMWDHLGRPTDDVTCCVVAHFPDPTGSRAFINLSKEAESVTDGIDYDDYGWFIWDDCKGEYLYLEEDTIDALRKILSKEHYQ